MAEERSYDKSQMTEMWLTQCVSIEMAEKYYLMAAINEIS